MDETEDKYIGMMSFRGCTSDVMVPKSICTLTNPLDEMRDMMSRYFKEENDKE